jgi:alpha-beta hydrolase superfamily lysophospholipase
MPFFDGVTGPVYYRHWAAEDPIAAVVFLHGFGEHSGLYHRLAAALDARRISFWALDEIGHGLTPGARGHVERIDDLEENGRRLARLAADAEPGVPLIVGGHSLGSIAAALLIGRDPAPFAGAILSGTLLSEHELPGEADGGEGIQLAAADLSSDPAYLDWLEHDPLAFTGSETPPTHAIPAVWEELATGSLAAVRIPVLFVHGTEDPIAPVEANRAWAEVIPTARLIEYPGGRHDILNDVQHRVVAADIATFVEAVTGVPASTA